jgi:hypothetical protein
LAVQKGDDFTRLVAYVEERTVLEERLQKMEAFRGQIKELIFRRVQRDYSTRLTTIREQFRPVLLEIVKKLKGLEAEKDRLSEQLEQSNDLLTELRFRNEIGEFEEPDFREQEDGFLLRIDELSANFEEQRHTIAQYMFYLHDDKDFRQAASAEKILERLEEDFRADRARAAELDQARWQSQRQASAALPPGDTRPLRLEPAQISASQAGGADEPIEAELVESDSADFLVQAFGGQDAAAQAPAAMSQAGAAGSSSNNHGHATPTPSREASASPRKPVASAPAAGAQAPAPAPRRAPDARTDPRLLKSKVIRKAPNPGA